MRRPLLLTLLTLATARAAAQDAARPEPAAEAAPAPAPEQPRARSRFEGLGRTPEQEKLLEELSEAVQRYEEESREFRQEVQQLIERKYQQKRDQLSKSYEKAISEVEARQRQDRLEAIARFEEFLRRYPNEPRYTPDVMFRLAELYFERSSDTHMLAQRQQTEQLNNLPEGAEPPPEPQPDFNPSIELYKQLIARFPDYRLNDGAWYLLGYCLEQQNAFEDSRAAYQQLIARYPTSRFTTEAWVRIGEYYFDAYNEPDALAKAAAAYEQAIKNTSHPLYDKALYKLGWTYYRMDLFDEAVTRFVTLMDFYEAQRAAKGDEAGGGDLRKEALQYTAISFADETWGGLDKAQAFFARIGPRPYEAEVYRRLGDVYFDQTNHDAAITAYRLVLQKDPLAPDAPQLQQKIVQAYQRDRKLTEATAESQKLSELYSPGSEWYQKYQNEPDVLAAADELAEKSLTASAFYHHEQARVFKKEGKLDEATASFKTAAIAYGKYLQRFPRSKNAYEMEYYYADCLYFSLQFGEAAKHYEAVRDSTLGKKYFADSTQSAVFSWQKQLDADIKAGKQPPRPPLLSKDRPEGQKVQPSPLSDLEEKLVAASDVYVAKLPKDERAPKVAYTAAELYYAHDDFPEARRRFEAIIQSYPQHEVARFSTNLVVETFLIDKDWRGLEEVSGKLADNKGVIDPNSHIHKELVGHKLSGRFKLADQLLAEGKYEEAAAKYLQLVNEAPQHEFADKALNNAAVAYEKTRRFDSALKLYERVFREYPSSSLAAGALFRVAVNAESSYDFDKAVNSYQKLVKDYPASKDREAALFNAARLLEGQQRYTEAAAAFQRYADLFPNAEDAPRNQFQAAVVLEKQEDWKGEIRTLEAFVRKFASRPAQVELVVDAKRRMGNAWMKLKNEKEALRAYESAASEFDRRKLQPDAQPLAADAAAYSRFQLAEAEFRKFDKLKIGGKGKALERSFTDKRAGVKSVNEAYARVFPYKRLEWTLAALYRRGYALERFANTIIETPIPPDVKRLGEEAVVAYQDMLSQQTAALEDGAVESYTATLQEARKNRLANEWTKKTLEALNRFRPNEYPVLKEAKNAIASEPLYPEGLLDGPGASTKGGAK
ncbi:tetratricopeptide repeat protein [Archangium violaceum]|uniref:tetratricopeptide repeat protein n=1 Tax=Archangium violaceum TaxID=83451 RepID=UPI0019527DA6|nr:tetratricopeptide repeat protein [Archangium violaceum]QRN94976.1 tetratricopeptide repeat protein [Archangium violaceum]